MLLLKAIKLKKYYNLQNILQTLVHILLLVIILQDLISHLCMKIKELNCVEKFLKLSLNRNEVCLKDWKGNEDIETSKIVLASGEYNLRFPKMPE